MVPLSSPHGVTLSLYDSYDIVHTTFCNGMYCSQNWTKIKKPDSQSIQWPVGRYAHAASHITGPVFVMSGGIDDDDKYTLSDMWLYDTTTNQWIKVFHNVTI